MESSTQEIVMVPLGGSTLSDWVNKNYLKNLGTKEYHIYNSDNRNAHAADCGRVNGRNDGSSARMTRNREIENYIDSGIAQDFFGVQITIDDTMDVSTEISRLIHETDPEGYNPDTVKKA